MIISNKRSKMVTILTTIASFLGLGSIITISANNSSLQNAGVEAREKSKYNLSKNKISLSNSKQKFKEKYVDINNHLISKETINNSQQIYHYLLNNKYLKVSPETAAAIVYIAYSETGCSPEREHGFINWNNKYQKEFTQLYSNKQQQHDLSLQLDFFMSHIICKHSASEQSKLIDDHSINDAINYIYHNIFYSPEFAHPLNQHRLNDVREMIEY